jgi:RNA polymerase sigma-70 factor, ECF subfamily
VEFGVFGIGEIKEALVPEGINVRAGGGRESGPESEGAVRLREIFDEYSGSLLRFLKRLNMERPGIAEDLLQETMLRVWRYIDRVPGAPNHVLPWLYTIARNVSADEARKRGRRPMESFGHDHDIQAIAGTVDPMHIVIATESMLDAYRNLSPAHKRAFDEVHLLSRSAIDAANALAIPVGTVKSRAFYAMASVRTATVAP